VFVPQLTSSRDAKRGDAGQRATALEHPKRIGTLGSGNTSAMALKTSIPVFRSRTAGRWASISAGRRLQARGVRSQNIYHRTVRMTSCSERVVGRPTSRATGWCRCPSPSMTATVGRSTRVGRPRTETRRCCFACPSGGQRSRLRHWNSAGSEDS
jgi:hypothetical protein